eukprot:2872426-Alexandrium_andersonii.AAC.1
MCCSWSRWRNLAFSSVAPSWGLNCINVSFWADGGLIQDVRGDVHGGERVLLGHGGVQTLLREHGVVADA